MPAHMTAKIVMASANRLIALRHDWLSKSRIAEISVPAWPIPIHQTKLTIANPHPIGMLMPQIPTPLMISQLAAPISNCNTLNAIRKPKIHPMVIFRLRTMPPILSDTDARLCPSSITGPTSIVDGSSTGCAISAFLLRFLHFRIGVANLGEISRARPRVQFRQQRVVQAVPLPFGNAALRVVQISEHNGLRRASGRARGHDFAIAHLAVLLLGRDLCVIDALHAVGALLHNTAASYRDIRIALQLQAFRFPIGEQQEVEPAHLIRAVVRTVAGPDATVVDHIVQ